jgi:hypothetical protein
MSPNRFAISPDRLRAAASSEGCADLSAAVRSEHPRGHPRIGPSAAAALPPAPRDRRKRAATTPVFDGLASGRGVRPPPRPLCGAAVYGVGSGVLCLCRKVTFSGSPSGQGALAWCAVLGNPTKEPIGDSIKDRETSKKRPKGRLDDRRSHQRPSSRTMMETSSGRVGFPGRISETPDTPRR